MEVNDRFINLSTTGASVLEFLTDDRARKSSIIRELMESCEKIIHKELYIIVSPDVKILKTYRIILCHEYQTLVNSRKDNFSSASVENSCVDIANFFVRNIKDFLNSEEFALLYDIAILQLVLRSTEKQVFESFKNFHETWNKRKTTAEGDDNLRIRVYECFADSYNLRFYLYDGERREKDLEELRVCILSAIESWMKQEDNIEWRLLASLLPKLVVTFGARNIVTPLWGKVLDVRDDLGKTLAALCVMADVCFSSEGKDIGKTHYERCVGEEFWSLLLRGLISDVYQQRKQALYLAKRALDFIDSYEFETTEEFDKFKESIVPFFRKDSTIGENSTNLARTNFFLILESLEEKQKHLVLPALTRLSSLVDACSESNSHGYGLGIVCLRCIFKRILRHDNNAVKILGLREILKSNLDIYDQEFMDFLANILNNTFLYDYDEINDEKEPEIVSQLEEFFLRSEKAKISLINTFVRAISRVSWCPVAIYWILQALVGVTKRQTIVYNAWTCEELRCVKNLIERNLTKHCRILRINSQDLILKAFCEYTKSHSNWSDIELIGDTLDVAIEGIEVVRSANNIVAHLSKLVKSSEAQLYVTRTCAAIMEKRNVASWSLSIVLLAESNLILNRKDCLAKMALRRLFENSVNANRRPYADTALILRVMKLMSHLSELSNLLFDSEHENLINRLLLPYCESMLRFIESSFEKTGISEFNEYLMAMRAFLKYSNLQKDPAVMNMAETFHKKCANIILNPREFSKHQWLCALKMLNFCSKIHFIDPSDIPCVQSALRYFKDEILNDNERDGAESSFNSKGKFVSDCCKILALLMSQSIDLEPSNVQHWVEVLYLFVQTDSEQVVEPVAATLFLLVEYYPLVIVENLDIVNYMIRQLWHSVFQLNKNREFFMAIMSLTTVTMHTTFLKMDGTKEFAIEYVHQLMEEGKNVPHLKHMFIEEMENLPDKDMLDFRKSFMSCLLHGAVPRLDQRIEQSTISHCKIDFFMAVNSGNGVRARAAIVLLDVLKKSKESESEFRENVLMDLLSILQKNLNKRYFDNSHLHRLKHKAMQTLLIMEPYLNKEERKILYVAMCDSLIGESNQPSVRLMQEWLIVRIYAKNSIIRESIWKLFETAIEKRPGSIVSLASVVFHVSRLLEGWAKIDFIAKAITHLLPNCMSQQFSVRLYSQTIIVKIYKMLPSDNLESEKYRGIYEAVETSLSRGNLTNNSLKVVDDFYFTIFHPKYDYNLEMIYYQLPRLTGLSADEWIKPDLFRIFRHRDDDDDTIIKIIPSNNDEIRIDWSTIKPVKKSQRPTGLLEEETDPSNEGGLSDVQKKIIPWKSMIPISDELSKISKISTTRQKTWHEDTGIIVVASLIDRPPNLGGLARTCEIFGAKELIIGSLRYADDREFQTLSVSAEKWIKITEVKPHLLKSYLLEQRYRGWKLVGAEQTANSTNLCDMDFDKKTILLLGNEKDGIPANLIPILDTCVEIPQNGVVRSLNVHVTGAICIWQYVKQHLLP